MKHEQHYSAPFALSSRVAHPVRTFLRAITIVSTISVLAACGNNTEVEPNTNANTGGNNGGSGTTYTGSVAAVSDEVQKFQTEFWGPLAGKDRCGQCHTNDGQASNFPFVRLDNINDAHAAATATNNSGQLIVDRSTPGNSRVVVKVAEGHQCWGSLSDTACADIIEGYIENWTSGNSTMGGRSISLSAPRIFDAGRSRNFPETALDGSPNFKTSLYDPFLVKYCADCHSDSSDTPQAPFFASGDIDVAYAAARSKMNLDAVSGTPPDDLEPLPLDSVEQSRFVTRVLELHNCWTAECSSDADEMRMAIFNFAQGIPLTELDPTLITSKAMTFTDATLASGGNRYENDQIAVWEFKTGQGNQAFDTSGIEPAMTLTFNGSVSWVLGYGIELSNGGFAKALPETSEKLTNLIGINNTYSIETWVIPANVTQEDARIISYESGSGTTRNFAMSQSLYQYEYLNRATNNTEDSDGALLTFDEDEDLQSALQHVVYTFDPVNGRRIYVNGVFTEDADSPDALGGSLVEWDDTFNFVLGSGNAGNEWNGKLRMVAIHNSALTQDQISQNFNVGVGQKYFMLFSVGELLGLNNDEAFVMLQTELYDNTAYLFDKPVFINLNGEYIPTTDIPVEGLRIGINGREAITGQMFGNLDVDINSTDYTPNGQPLSRLGTVIPVGKGPENDEFFLTFERMGSGPANPRVEAEPVAPAAPPEADPVSDIGVKTFDEINASMSFVTGIPTTNTNIETTYASYKQQLPAIEDIKAFLSSHQMGVAQLAMSYCNELVTADKALPANDANRMFKDFNFGQPPSTAFASVSTQIIDPLLVGLMNLNTNNLSTQPNPVVVNNQLSSSNTQNLFGTELDPSGATVDQAGTYNFESLLTQMTQCGAACPDTAQRTEQVVIAICAATLGSSMTIIQ